LFLWQQILDVHNPWYDWMGYWNTLVFHQYCLQVWCNVLQGEIPHCKLNTIYQPVLDLKFLLLVELNDVACN
jgi:hypothetical protein